MVVEEPMTWTRLSVSIAPTIFSIVGYQYHYPVSPVPDIVSIIQTVYVSAIYCELLKRTDVRM